MTYPLPFTSHPPENKLTLARGSYGFINVQVTINGTGAVPDAATWTGTTIRRIEDPDGNDITASWVTNVLDPSDTSDVYDATHATYVGGLASPANTGLFHNGSGAIGQKVKVPSAVELTYLSASRHYKMVWSAIKVNGDNILDDDGENFELFDVGPAGILAFGQVLVTATQVTAGIVTVLTSTQVEALIEESVQWARARLRTCRLDPDTVVTEDDERIYNGILLYSRMLIFDRDASAGYKVHKAQEGTKRIERAGMSDKTSESLLGRAKEEMAEFCADKGKLSRPRLKVAKRALPGESDDSYLTGACC